MDDDVKLTLNPAEPALTPSQELIKKAATEVAVVDAIGRTIKLKKPGVLAQFRLVEALGETAKNQVYAAMVLPLIYVVAIDDMPIYQPTRKSEIEALIQQLDEHGVNAVMEAVQKNFGAADPDSDKAELKK